MMAFLPIIFMALPNLSHVVLVMSLLKLLLVALVMVL